MTKHNISTPTTAPCIYTAIRGKNADLIAQCALLYTTPGCSIADVTYGKGTFWRKVDLTRFDFLPTDLKTGVDFRQLPYAAESIDIVVLDPPYAHNPGTMFVDTTYNNRATTIGPQQEACITMTYSTSIEAVCKRHGVY